MAYLLYKSRKVHEWPIRNFNRITHFIRSDLNCFQSTTVAVKVPRGEGGPKVLDRVGAVGNVIVVQLRGHPADVVDDRRVDQRRVAIVGARSRVLALVRFIPRVEDGTLGRHRDELALRVQLLEDLVEYGDGTSATVEQMSLDVTHFLNWTAEPELEARKKTGTMVLIYLTIFAGLLYFSMRRIWADQH